MENVLIPEIDRARCTRCGACVIACPVDAVEMTAHGLRIVRPAACTDCGACEDVCPTHAVTRPFGILWAPETG
jgi:ferredoxin